MKNFADHVISVLNPVPSDQWITSSFTNGEDRCCAIGHYQRLTGGKPGVYSLKNCSDRLSGKLRIVTGAYMKHKGIKINRLMPIAESIADINNRKIGPYTQETPKERIMAFLMDMSRDIEDGKFHCEM